MKINQIKSIKALFALLAMSLFFSCNNDDDTTNSLDANVVGVYAVNSIKSNYNLKTGDYIPRNTELIPLFTCDEITLELKSDFTFIWNAQKIYQDFVYDTNNVIQSSSDLKCTPLTVNGMVTAITDTSFSLEFTHNGAQETAVFELVNNKWQYQATENVFFMGHASLVDGVDTFFSNVALTMVYQKL